MNDKNSISVVIPNYNGTGLLRENLPFLYEALQSAAVPFEVIVSDDASTDDSVSFIKENYPEIILVISKENRGFAPTANAGIYASSKKLVFLLNSDVQLTKDYFFNQFKYFDHQDTFGVMGRIIGLNNDDLQDGAKTQYDFGLKIGSNKNLIPIDERESNFPTLYLSGANALVDREKLLKLKGFDELYAPFYGEDLDLSLRAWKVGWKCYYNHQSVCRHPNSVTINKYNKKKKIRKIIYRNRFIMHAIHLTGWQLAIWNVWVMLQWAVKICLMQKEFVEGFAEFKKMKNQIEISKEKLEALEKSENKKFSNEEVYNYLRKRFSEIPHQVL